MVDRKKRKPGLSEGELFLYGTHAVKAALDNEQRLIKRLVATKNAAARFLQTCERRNIGIEIVSVSEISRLVGGDAVHQGLALAVEALDGGDIYDIGDAQLIVVLDQVTDPHNVGAITRSAVALGASAIITTHRHAARETGLLAKTASGGVDMIQHIHVPNLAQALVKLDSFGFVTIGLDSEGEGNLTDMLFGEKIALVLGAEGTGLRRLTRERCAVLARLDMPGAIKSLNVSNAAVLSLYLASRHLGL